MIMKIKFKNSNILYFAVWLLFVSYFVFWYLTKQIVFGEDKICHENVCFEVEIADDMLERQKWLMFREELAEKRWMIFVFSEDSKHAFWMKNTLIPLDMIWIDKDYKIVDIQNAIPCKTEICQTYNPKGNSRYVLEIWSELTKKYGIEIWDILEFRFKN